MTVISTLHFPRRPAWAGRVRMLDRTTMSRTALLRELLRQATEDDIVVLDGGIGARDGYVDRVAAFLLARRPRPPRVVITDSTWNPGPARRAALRTFDTPRTTYCVLSGAERDGFPARWGVDPHRVAVTPFYWTLEDPPEPVPDGSGIFAGGDSLRDHATLLAAVADLDEPTVIASRTRPPGPVPPHVIFGPVPPERFEALLRASAVVVVPLQAGMRRSAGQQTYLNGMVLGKPVVVSDVPGAREHVIDGETGLLVPPGDPVALAGALRWVLDPANADAVRRMGARAREAVLTEAAPDRYVARLLDVVDGLPA